MLPDTTTHLLQLVTVALDDFETLPVPASVRRAWRIARLRGDLVESFRFALELGLTDEAHSHPGGPGVEADLQQAVWQYKAGRTVESDPALIGLDSLEDLTMRPVDQLVLRPAHFEDQLSRRTQMEHQNRREIANGILADVGNTVFQYLLRCETTLRLSATGERIFDRYRSVVDRMLEQIAPEVLDMLNAAIRRSTESGDSESRVHALTSCRRVLVAVADAIFPARSEQYIGQDGESRAVGPSQYRNRIMAALDSADSARTRRRAVSALIQDFAVRLDRLDALTQKGVHENPTAHDVDFGVIQTYAIAGEILELASSDLHTPDA